MEPIDDSLRQYIAEKILPQYQDYDKGHRTDHILSVIENSLDIAGDYDVNIEMVYVIAAYHDIGMRYGRKDHHLTSGKVLAEDNNLREWFDENQLEIMKEAIEDHRASNDYEPRSLYGKIISEADRVIDAETILYRTMEYGKARFPDYSFDEQAERVYKHVKEKYGEHGYLKLWLKTGKNEKGLSELRELLKDKDKFINLCGKYY